MIEQIKDDLLKELNCYNQLNFLKQKVQQKFVISKDCPIFVKVSNSLINGMLFSLFDNKKCLNKQKNKNLYQEKVPLKSRDLIEFLFKKISCNELPYDQKQGDFIRHVKDNIPTVYSNRDALSHGKQVWDKLAPNLSSNYTKTYFKFSGYKVQNTNEKNKRTFVVQFKESEEQSIICFFETQQSFSKKDIDQIMKQALQQQLQQKPEKNFNSSEQITSQVKPKRQQVNSTEEQLKTQQTQQKQIPINSKRPSYQSKMQQNKEKTLQGQQIIDLQPLQQEIIVKKSLIQRSNRWTYIFLIIMIAVFGFEIQRQNQFYSDFADGKIQPDSYQLSNNEVTAVQIKREIEVEIIFFTGPIMWLGHTYVQPAIDYISGVCQQIKTNPTLIRFKQFVVGDVIAIQKTIKHVFRDIFLNDRNDSVEREEL